MLQLRSAFGILALLVIAWGLGENRRMVSLRQAAIGLAVTVITAVILIKLPIVARAFWRHQRGDLRGLACGHLVRVRLCGRRVGYADHLPDGRHRGSAHLAT